MIVAAQTGDSRNLWRLTLDPLTFRVTGSPERVTSGASTESHPAIGGKLMVFSSVQENSDIWYLPLKADEARVTGGPHRLTMALTQEVNCAVTADGSRVVYGVRRPDGGDFVPHDVATGATSVVACGAIDRPAPRISPDGSNISYYLSEAGARGPLRSFVIPSSGGVAKTMCEDCQARTWANDGKRLVVTVRKPLATGFLDLTTRQFRPIVEAGASAPRTSWDDRWFTFYALTPARAQHAVHRARSRRRRHSEKPMD